MSRAQQPQAAGLAQTLAPEAPPETGHPTQGLKGQFREGVPLASRL